MRSEKNTMTRKIKWNSFLLWFALAMTVILNACSQYSTTKEPQETPTQSKSTPDIRTTNKTFSLQSIEPTAHISAHLWLEGEIVFAATNQVGLVVIPDGNKSQDLVEMQAVETGQNPVFLSSNRTRNQLGWVANETEILSWRVNGSEAPLQVAEPDLPVTGIAINPGGDEIVYATLDGGIVRKSLLPGAQAFSGWTAPHWLANLSYSPDGKQIGGADLSGFRVYIFDLNGNLTTTLEWANPVTAALYGVYFSPDWSLLAWVSGSAVQLMDLRTRQFTHMLNHEDAVSEAVWSPDGKWLATASAVNDQGNLTPVVDVWDGVDGTLAASFLQEFPVQSISFSPGGHEVSVLDTNAFIRIFTLP